MDLFNKINSEVDSFIIKNRSLISDNCKDSINLKMFEQREELIKQLNLFVDSVPVLLEKITSELDKAKITHSAEISAADAILNKNKKVTKKKSPRQKSYASVVNSDTPKSLAPVIEKYTRIKLTEALSLPAIKVSSFDLVKQDGELYYIENSEHFAIRIAGHLLHGNIGDIYTDEKNPSKIKDCKFANLCMKQDKCDYYHDPVKFSESKDHRNFIASSFLYAPPNSYHKSFPRSRRFGSLQNLDIDIVGLVDEEIFRFHDQTMHDLLCSLLLHKAHLPS